MKEIMILYLIIGASIFLNIMQVLFSNMVQVKYVKEQEKMARVLARYLEQGEENGRVKE